MLRRVINFNMQVVPGDDLHPPRSVSKNEEIDKVLKTLRHDLYEQLKFGEVIISWGTRPGEYEKSDA